MSFELLNQHRASKRAAYAYSGVALLCAYYAFSMQYDIAPDTTRYTLTKDAMWQLSSGFLSLMLSVVAFYMMSKRIWDALFPHSTLIRQRSTRETTMRQQLNEGVGIILIAFQLSWVAALTLGMAFSGHSFPSFIAALICLMTTFMLLSIGAKRIVRTLKQTGLFELDS